MPQSLRPLKILLFGKSGQVGWELQRSLAALGEVHAPGRNDSSYPVDFTNPESAVAAVRACRPDVIVNAAAHTAVDKAESEPNIAFAINAQTPEHIAREASDLGALFVHYSTDYVFDGTGMQPWTEDSPTGPLNVYGCSKLAGEQAIQRSGCLHLIFRTSWVFGARGGNFAKTMLKLAAERETLKVVADQHGAPTGADLLADVSAHAIRMAWLRPELSGTYHAAASGETTWHGYASHVVDYARRAGVPLKASPERVEPVATEAFPTAARRPGNSRLNSSRLQGRFGLVMPHWQTGVDRMLHEFLC